MSNNQGNPKTVTPAEKPDDKCGAPRDKEQQSKSAQERNSKSRWSNEGGKR